MQYTGKRGYNPTFAMATYFYVLISPRVSNIYLSYLSYLASFPPGKYNYNPEEQRTPQYPPPLPYT